MKLHSVGPLCTVFLKQLIRDHDFKFGGMHKRLLRLPWRDVFTTNWDTLLEQAGFSVSDRAYSYSVVQSMDEIPLNRQAAYCQIARVFSRLFPTYLHRRGLSKISDTICSICKHSTAINDGDCILADRIFRQ